MEPPLQRAYSDGRPLPSVQRLNSNGIPITRINTTINRNKNRDNFVYEITTESPRRRKEVNQFGYNSNFDIVVKAPLGTVTVRIMDAFFTSVGEILKDACKQLNLDPAKYDLYFKHFNLSSIKKHMLFTAENVRDGIVEDPKFRWRRDMELRLEKRPAGGLFGCVGGVCPRKGGTRRSNKGSKSRRYTRRN